MELKHKKIAFLGDSITQGCGTTAIENRYDNVLMREEGLSAVFNYGIGGTRIAHQKNPTSIACFDLNFCGRAFLIDQSADMIVVFGGVNDYLHGDAPIGTTEDHTPATFYGAVWYLMKTLKENYPQTPIAFITPAHCFFENVSDREISKNGCKQPDALPLQGYVNIIKERAAEFHIPVLDLYNELGIDPNDPVERKEYTIDGLHFNDKGHIVIAHKLSDFLKQL